MIFQAPTPEQITAPVTVTDWTDFDVLELVTWIEPPTS